MPKEPELQRDSKHGQLWEPINYLFQSKFPTIIETMIDLYIGWPNKSPTWVGLALDFGCSIGCLILLGPMRDRQNEQGSPGRDGPPCNF